MITKIHVQNFRSLEKADLPLSKINVLTGLNNSGKTSLLQAMAMLKNIATNSNKPVDQLLMLPQKNFGGFSELIYNKNTNKKITFGITYKKKRNTIQYNISLAQNSGTFHIKYNEIENKNAAVKVNFPYPLNQEVQINDSLKTPLLNWNGISATPLDQTEKALQATEYINYALESIQGFDYVESDIKFSRILYGNVAITDYSTEEQIASAIAIDRNLEGKISYYFEKVFDEKFSVRPLIGTSNFHLQTQSKNTGFVTDLANQGSGQNQIIYLLARILRPQTSLICLDEPAIHLHPSTIGKLMQVLVEIADTENKQILLATHSEHLVNALIMQIVKKELKPKDLNVFYLEKQADATRIERQKINEDGQLEGGLKHFLDEELKDLKIFLKAQ